MSYVTLEQAKDHLRVDFDDDDVYIGDLIDVAETSVFNEIRSAVDGVGTVTTAGTISLTGTGTLFTNYEVGDILKVVGETKRTIATIVSDTSLTVTVAFSTTETGLAFTIESSGLVSGVLPKPLYQGILLMVGHLYNSREPVIIGTGVVKVPYSLEYLLAPYKTWTCR